MQDNQTYINLARKYRPQVIADLIGQEALVQTLENAFKLNRVHHAFMLTGVRGTGKTTTARIIAKALNCTGVDGNGGITLNPCGVCESCVSINNDSNMDVLEMDAASRTGVDDVREIIENAKYKPVSSRYKIFIIDEVHMLSKNAFNALLKTLEEPPAHLKFIFATTEIRKVPITVLSRCQRFDLKRVSVAELSQHLAKICGLESVSFDEESLFLLAKSANGSVRDSLSLLDQAIVYADRNLVAAKIIEMLGVGAKEDIYNLFLSVVNKDSAKTFELLNMQFSKGIELDLLLEDMLEICHNASVIKITSNPKFLDSSEVERNKAIEIAETSDLPSLVKLWQIIIKGIKEVKDSGNSLIFANMVFTKMLLVADLGDVGKMIDFLKSSEKKNLTSNPKVVNTLPQPPAPQPVPTVAPIIPPQPVSAPTPVHATTKTQPQTPFDDVPPPSMEDYGMPAPQLPKEEPQIFEQKTNTSVESNTEQQIKQEVSRLFPSAVFVGKENA
ncbi:MAG: DNA polymerase III subunit gamma/tau [Alphaproteobacteria bacterium]|jgi:DNA polymerase-3 subunit gamma/tau|nr:DNA polymerase III subunit gamma/tau [Alphaproteobacteria bacterium]